MKKFLSVGSLPKRKKSMRKNLRVRKKNLKKNKKKNFPKCLKKFFAEGGVLYFGLEVALIVLLRNFQKCTFKFRNIIKFRKILICSCIVILNTRENDELINMLCADMRALQIELV